MQEFWDTLRVRVLVADVATVSPTWGDGVYHSDPYGRLYWLQAGRAAVTHHKRRWTLRQGRLHVIPANTPVQLHCPDRATIAYVHFTAAVWGEMDLFEVLGGPYDLQPSPSANVPSLLQRLRRAFHDANPQNTLDVTGLLLQLLAPFQAVGDKLTLADRRRYAVQRVHLRFTHMICFSDI